MAYWLGLPLAVVFSLYVAFCVICTTIHNRAEYAGFELEGTDDEFWSGGVGSYYGLRKKPLSESELFLKFPEHEAVSIHEITPEYLEKNFAIELSVSDYGGKFFTRTMREQTIIYSGFGLQMEFERGHLNDVLIAPGNLSWGDGVTCSNRRDGQYIALPIRCGELYKAWGKPETKERRRVVNEFRVD